MFQVLALEIDGPLIRCAVAARKSLKKIHIISCESFARLEDEEGAPLSADELSMVAARLPALPRDCVVVTPRAAFLQMVLPPAQGKRKLRGRRLLEALRQESEAYTGMPAAEMLLGFERLPDEPLAAAPAPRAPQAGDAFWLTAYPLEEYRQLKEVLAESGLKLKRVYPPDCCFPAAAAFFAPRNAPAVRLVLDAGSALVRLAGVKGGRLRSYRTVPLFAAKPYREYTREEWEELLAELGLEAAELARIWAGGRQGEPGMLSVTGVGSLEESVLTVLRSFVDAEAAALLIPAARQAAPGSCGGDFASVVGAALRELLLPYLSSRSPGVSDQPSAWQALAQKAYLVPVSVLLLFFLVFGVHYLLIMRQIEAESMRLEELRREQQEVQSAVARMEEEEKRAAALGEQRLLLADKTDYLQNRLPQYGALLHAVLAAMDAEAGAAIKFVQIEMLDRGGQFIISGESADSGSIHRMAVALQGERWCTFAKVEEIVREVWEAEAVNGEELLPEDDLFLPPPPEEGLLPGEELPGMEPLPGEELPGLEPIDLLIPGEGLPGPEPGGDAAFMEPDPFADMPEAGVGLDMEGEAGAAAVVFRFRTRVVVLPQYFPERPFAEAEQNAQPVTGETGGRIL